MTLSLMDISLDRSYKWEYDRVINKTRNQQNTVGPQLWQILTPKPSGTYLDADTIFVHLDTGNDSTGSGTAANPYKSMQKGASMCVAAKRRVVVSCTASSKYVKDDYNYPVTFNVYYEAMYSETGKTIYWTNRTVGYTPTDANTIYVAKTGSDSNAGTAAAPVLTLTGATGAISKCTASKQHVMFLDSGTYDETAFSFTGNFLSLYADYGCTPTITINQNVSSTTYTPFTLKTTLIDGSGTCSQPLIAKFDDDSFVVAWVISNTGQFAMYRNNNYCYKTKTQFDPAVNTLYAVFILPISQNVVFIFKSTNTNLYYKIYNKNGTEVKAVTQIANSGTPVSGHGAAFSDDTWVACWCDSAASYGYYFATFNSTGTAVLTKTYIGAGDAGHIQDICCGIQSNDNIIFGYINASGKGDISIINSDGVYIKSYSTNINVDGSTNWAYWNGGILVFSDDSFIYAYGNAATLNIFLFDYNYNFVKRVYGSITATSGSSICKLENDNFITLLLYGDGTMKLEIYDKDINAIFSKTTISSSINWAYSSCFANSNGNIIVARCATTTFYLSYSRISDFYFIGVNVAVNAVINGITIDCENQDYLKYIYTGASNLTRKWCKHKNQSSTFFDAYSILTGPKISLLTGQLDRRNEYNHDVYNGDDVTNTVAKSYNCIFLNSDGIDFTVSGTAASTDDITYRNNTVQNAAGGIYLVGNGGTNETIYNNIFNNVSDYDISSAVSIIAYNCISTGAVNNVTLSACSTLNPLFINGGELGSEFANLDLKSTTMGDVISSPGLLMGSDGENVGAYKTRIIGPVDTYTSFTISGKPLTQFERNIKWAGASKFQLSDGAFSTSATGAAEVITFNHSEKATMLYSEFVNWLTMMLKKKPNARFYPNPVTAPSTYFDVILFFDDTPAYAPTYKIDSEYKCKVKYSFAYKITA